MAADASAPGAVRARQQQAGVSAWASVVGIPAGSEVLIARTSVPPARYRLLSVQDDGLTILDVSDSEIPEAVAGQLQSDASNRPGVFLEARNGREFALTSRLTIGPSGVTDQERFLFPLSLIVIDVPREDVAEVSVIRKHIGRHAGRGMVIGAIIGAVAMGAGSFSCADCGSAGGWVAGGALIGAMVGLKYGTVVGVIAPRSPDLVYRR